MVTRRMNDLAIRFVCFRLGQMDITGDMEYNDGGGREEAVGSVEWVVNQDKGPPYNKVIYHHLLSNE